MLKQPDRSIASRSKIRIVTSKSKDGPALSGKKGLEILLPSSGGNGSRLKTNSERFRSINIADKNS